MDNRGIAWTLIEGLWAGRLSEANEHPGYWPGLHTFDYVRGAFPDLSAFIKKQVADDDTVVTHLELSGTHSGPFLGPMQRVARSPGPSSMSIASRTAKLSSTAPAMAGWSC